MDIDRSFVRVGADWTVDAALQLIAAFPRIKNVIVHRVDQATQYFYAYGRDRFVQKLATQRGRSVFDALDLHEYTATRAVPADSADPDDRVVVLDRGRIAGVAEPAGSGLRGDDSLLPPSMPGLNDLRGIDATPTDHHGGEGPDPTAVRGLAAVAPARVARGATNTVMVKLLAAGVAGGAAAVAVAAGDKLKIVLEASDAIELVGETQGTFEITGANELALGFDFRGRELGFGQITIHAFKGTSRVAWFSVSVQVVEAAPAVTPPVERRAEIRVERPADLEIDIYENKRDHTFSLELTAADSGLGLNRRRFSDIPLAGDIDRYFTQFYGEIEKLLSSADTPANKLATLGQKGLHLFQRIVPEDVRTVLWGLRDRIKSIQIQSDEPWIPWEVCRLFGKDDTGAIVNGSFISEQYAVTRWFLGMPRFTTLTLKSIGLVVPTDSGLRAAPAEQRAVAALADAAAGRTVTEIPCHPVDLRTQLASATYDALHFTGHGAYDTDNADRSSIKLSDGSRFYPEDLAGEVSNLGAKKPIVFLNACEVGRAGTAPGGLAGWPQEFVSAGAAAFIAPFWKIGDGSSSQFASAFYAALLGGSTIGEAVHTARAEIRKASDPTWLAYVAYAHPDAKLRLP